MMDYVFQKLLIIGAAVQPPSRTDFSLPDVGGGQGTAEKLLGIVIGVVAAVTILVIIIGAFNIVTGGGDPDKISRGKKTVIFALVGLAIVVSAEAIVTLVLGGLNK